MMEAQTDNEEEQKQVAKGTSEQGEESAGGDSTGKKGGGLTYQDIQVGKVAPPLHAFFVCVCIFCVFL